MKVRDIVLAVVISSTLGTLIAHYIDKQVIPKLEGRDVSVPPWVI